MAEIALYSFFGSKIQSSFIFHFSYFIQSDVKYANVSGKYAIMKNSSLCQRAEQFVLEKDDELGMQGCCFCSKFSTATLYSWYFVQHKIKW